jgi:hypothetical protein
MAPGYPAGRQRPSLQAAVAGVVVRCAVSAVQLLIFPNKEG